MSDFHDEPTEPLDRSALPPGGPGGPDEPTAVFDVRASSAAPVNTGPPSGAERPAPDGHPTPEVGVTPAPAGRPDPAPPAPSTVSSDTATEPVTVVPGRGRAGPGAPDPTFGPAAPAPARGTEPPATGLGSGSPPPGSVPTSLGAVPPPPPPPILGGTPRHRLVAIVVVVALLAGGLGAGLGAEFGGTTSAALPPAPTKVPVIPGPGRTTTSGAGGSKSVAAVARTAIPAIVDINTSVVSATSEGPLTAAGTGMIITSSGEVLTNNHVVDEATKITISVQGHAGSYVASVIAVNPSNDVALLQIDGASGPFPTVDLGDSTTAVVGTPVVAIGNAQGLDQTPTTVVGTVTALDQHITAANDNPLLGPESLRGAIETDAPIEPGDSGGPLLNLKGQVVGIDTAASTVPNSESTLSYAIPINRARSIVRAMEQGRTSGGNVLALTPFLGIFGETSPTTGFGVAGSSIAGVAVADVTIGGPAEGAGIVAGDTITKLDTTKTTTISELTRIIAEQRPGDTVQVTYVDTSGVSHTATVTLEGIPK